MFFFGFLSRNGPRERWKRRSTTKYCSTRYSLIFHYEFSESVFWQCCLVYSWLFWWESLEKPAGGYSLSAFWRCFKLEFCFIVLQATYDKLNTEVVKYKMITTSILADRLRVLFCPLISLLTSLRPASSFDWGFTFTVQFSSHTGLHDAQFVARVSPVVVPSRSMAAWLGQLSGNCLATVPSVLWLSTASRRSTHGLPTSDCFVSATFNASS